MRSLLISIFLFVLVGCSDDDEMPNYFEDKESSSIGAVEITEEVPAVSYDAGAVLLIKDYGDNLKADYLKDNRLQMLRGYDRYTYGVRRFSDEVYYFIVLTNTTKKIHPGDLHKIILSWQEEFKDGLAENWDRIDSGQPEGVLTSHDKEFRAVIDSTFYYLVSNLRAFGVLDYQEGKNG